MSTSDYRCRKLILDAGPLLSLSPLRGLAETYLTVPQVLAELKDRKAKEHLERLGSYYGVKLEVMDPDPISVAAVIAKAKQTGDYAVLSQADISVLALTHSLHQKDLKEVENNVQTATTETTQDNQPSDENPTPPNTNLESSVEQADETPDVDVPGEDDMEGKKTEEQEELADDLEPLAVELHPLQDRSSPPPEDEEKSGEGSEEPSGPLYDDPSDSDDGEGEWITPDNVGYHKSKALDLIPSAKGKGKAKQDEIIGVGCMTADFAMQNVLLQMGLNLVSVDGKKIERVKTWALRCHACFKICKDSSKKFCPSCGNSSLIRTSITLSAPGASADTPAIQVHLKSNFQYRTRGTKYSIPAPKPGTAKGGSGEGLILREDQVEYMRAQKRAETKRERDEAKMVKGILNKGTGNGPVSSWMDPDWIPEIITVGAGGKGRQMKNPRMDGDLPIIGYGRKNPNERRKRK